MESGDGMITKVSIIVILALLISGCMGTDSDYVIQVTANPGLHFSGSYNVITANGQSTSSSVDGIGAGPEDPVQFSVRGNIVEATFQKKEDWAGKN